MAILITDECIICNACEPECPNNAIYSEGSPWTWGGGTTLNEVQLEDGSVMDAKALQAPLSEQFYYIVSGKCTECTVSTRSRLVLQYVRSTAVFLIRMW